MTVGSKKSSKKPRKKTENRKKTKNRKKQKIEKNKKSIDSFLWPSTQIPQTESREQGEIINLGKLGEKTRFFVENNI